MAAITEETVGPIPVDASDSLSAYVDGVGGVFDICESEGGRI